MRVGEGRVEKIRGIPRTTRTRTRTRTTTTTKKKKKKKKKTKCVLKKRLRE